MIELRWLEKLPLLSFGLKKPIVLQYRVMQDTQAYAGMGHTTQPVMKWSDWIDVRTVQE